MEERNGRFRKKRSNFSIISNEIIRDPELSLKAKGLYTLIQSYITIEGFTLYKWFLQSKCSEGKKAFNSAWNELKESGYLVQYRMQEPETRKFYWEYELLDEKEAMTPKGDYGYNEPLPQKGYNGLGSISVKDDMENGVDSNNTESNKTYENNIESIISCEDVMEQIGFSDFSFFEQWQAKEIAMLISDVYNLPDDNFVRIMGQDIRAETVKDRFRSLNHYHIQYVFESLRNTKTEVLNMRSYLLTALYNAPTTLESRYQNQISAGL